MIDKKSLRPVGELMKELGFNKDAPLDSQKAFVRHLIRSANQTSRTPFFQMPASEGKAELQDPQLSFDAEILGVQSLGTSVQNSRFKRR